MKPRRIVMIAVDLDDLPRMISDSVATALRVHGVVLDPAHERELGRNAAGVVALAGEVLREQLETAGEAAGEERAA